MCAVTWMLLMSFLFVWEQVSSLVGQKTQQQNIKNQHIKTDAILLSWSSAL